MNNFLFNTNLTDEVLRNEMNKVKNNLNNGTINNFLSPSILIILKSHFSHHFTSFFDIFVISFQILVTQKGMR